MTMGVMWIWKKNVLRIKAKREGAVNYQKGRVNKVGTVNEDMCQCATKSDLYLPYYSSEVTLRQSKGVLHNDQISAR